MAEKYYLSPLRIRDIVSQRYKWPENAVTVCDRTVQIIRAFTVVEMMIQQGDQVSNSAHNVISKILKNIYSSLRVIKQGMSDSDEMKHYAATLGIVMDRVYSLLDVSVLG